MGELSCRSEVRPSYNQKNNQYLDNDGYQKK
jgi:hypothetical protein